MPHTILIGEEINSSNNKVKRILLEKDEGALLRMVKEQAEGGASFIDVNSSMLMEKEQEALDWAVGKILDNSELGVSVDSSNSEILFHAAAKYGERVIINSLSSDRGLINRMIPIIVKSGAGLIIMLKSLKKMPAGVQERLELAEIAVGLLESSSVNSNSVFFDPVFTPVAMAKNGLHDILGTVQGLRKRHPQYRIVGGLSNVSYGMPMRRLINRTFLAMLISMGLDAIIADVTAPDLIETLKAAEFLVGHDQGGREILQYYRSNRS